MLAIWSIYTACGFHEAPATVYRASSFTMYTVLRASPVVSQEIQPLAVVPLYVAVSVPPDTGMNDAFTSYVPPEVVPTRICVRIVVRPE